jgi:predicted amidohydrolase YtcJ
VLIRNAEILSRSGMTRTAHVRIAAGRIAAVDPDLTPDRGETILEAGGSLLLPGLHDHHIHLAALAASLASVDCGPPAVTDPTTLRQRLVAAAAVGNGWLRGYGYHASVAGDIDRHWLDAVVRDRPLRIQHRSGRLWLFNSAALDLLGETGPLEASPNGLTGRLYDGDAWLRERLGARRPDLSRVGALLAGQGVTGVTETTPGNGPDALDWLRAAQRDGELPQRLQVMGDGRLDGMTGDDSCRPGPHKVHLHETDLPPLAQLCLLIQRSHAANRPVAVHCVTQAELIFALSALTDAGAIDGDRIEHASLTPPDVLDWMRDLGVIVVTQHNFLAERGSAYRREIASAELPWLYRGRSFLERGIRLAGGCDAPFGRPAPWAAMQAAIERCDPAGVAIGIEERLAPEEALALFLGPLDDPGGPPRQVQAGVAADLCLLDRNWAGARPALGAVQVTATLIGGVSLPLSCDRC